MTEYHANRGPSKLPRLTICAGSNRQSIGLPDESGPPAIFGTQTHALASAMIKLAPTDNLTVDDDADRATVQRDMARQFAQFAFDLLDGQPEGSFTSLDSEVRVPIARFTNEPGATGTADLVVFREAPDVGANCIEMIVADLKTGHAVVSVDPDSPDVWQLFGYGFGAEEMYRDMIRQAGKRLARIHLVIVQPPHGPPRQLTITDMELWAAKKRELQSLMAKVDLAERAPPEQLVYHLKPSEKGCKWCPAARALACPARAAWLDQYKREADYSRAALPPSAADMATLDRWYSAIPMLEQFAKDIEAAMRARIEAGEISTAAKLVQGRAGARRWTDPDTVEEIVSAYGIEEDALEVSVASPAIMEKVARDHQREGRDVRWWQEMQQHVVAAEGKPTLASRDDKRGEVSVAPKLRFPDLTNAALAAPAVVVAPVIDDFSDLL